MILLLAFLMLPLSGPWKLSYTTPNGLRREATLQLQVDGDTVTGTLASDRGTTPIVEGRISGNQISFVVVRKGNGDEIRIIYSGAVEGDTMRLRMEYGGRAPVAITGAR